MKYLEDTRLTQLSSDLTGAYLNTRGSGSPSGGSNVGRNLRNQRNRKPNRKGRGKKQQHLASSNSANSSPSKIGGTNNQQSSSPYLPTSTFHYNPAGYTSYHGGTAASSSRVIYGKIEAYTTKRAGSDKKTAYEVGERYAHEMEKLNEAVEEMKKKHLMENGGKPDGEIADGNEKIEGGDTLNTENEQEMKLAQGDEGEEAKPKSRGRSRSLDGVTFAGSPSKSTAITSIPELSNIDGHEEEHSAKRSLPLEGILKPPSNNKRWRATSFDISTGPSSFELEGTRRGRLVSTGNHDEIDNKVHPLIPQPSLYQSSIADYSGKGSSSLPTMVPRRLVTDLILTLNASFPDYDFGDARPSDFCTLSVPEAMRRINDNMSEFVSTTDKGRDFMPRFWAAMDDIVFGLKDAEVYSYAPQTGGGEDDPLGFLTQSLSSGMNAPASSGGCLLFPTEDSFMDELGLPTSLELPHRILTSPVTKSVNTAQVTLWAMNYFFVSRNKKRIVLFACVETIRSPQGEGDYEEEGDEYQYGENELIFDEARRSNNEEEKEGQYTYYQAEDLVVLRGGESNMADDGDNGVDIEVDEDEDIGDTDQEETDFDTGALNTSFHPSSSQSEMALS